MNETEKILAAVDAREMKARAAMAALIALGHTEADAEEMVFMTLGGGDLVELDANDREFYPHSGRLAKDIEREMEE